MTTALTRRRSSRGSGWCFYFAIPLGAPAAAGFAGAYDADSLGWPTLAGAANSGHASTGGAPTVDVADRGGNAERESRARAAEAATMVAAVQATHVRPEDARTTPPTAAPPPMPALLLALIQAPAISGVLAVVRTEADW